MYSTALDLTTRHALSTLKRTLFRAALLLAFLGQIGCSTWKSADSEALDKLSKAVAQKEKEIQFLKEENLVLKQKVSLKKKVAIDKNAPVEEASFATLFDRANDFYLRGDVDNLELVNAQVQKRFPSEYSAEKVLLLLGKLYYKRGSWGRALSPLNSLIEKYNYSPYRVAALYIKAMSYKELNLETIAEKLFVEIKETYPGSPEYFKASNEMSSQKKPATKM